MQQRLGNAQVRGGADRQELGQTFHNAKDNGQQILVQARSTGEGNRGWPRGRQRAWTSVAVRAVNRDTLLHPVYQSLRTCRVVAPRELRHHLVPQRMRTLRRGVRFFGAVLCAVHGHQHALPVRRVPQRLGGLRPVGKAVCVLFIHFALQRRTLRQALPVAAKLRVQQIVRC